MERFRPDKTATCKRCGDVNVSWERSRKGTFYLVQVDDNGLTARDEFHKCKLKVQDAGTVMPGGQTRWFQCSVCKTGVAELACKIDNLCTYCAHERDQQREAWKLGNRVIGTLNGVPVIDGQEIVLDDYADLGPDIGYACIDCGVEVARGVDYCANCTPIAPINQMAAIQRLNNAFKAPAADKTYGWTTNQLKTADKPKPFPKTTVTRDNQIKLNAPTEPRNIPCPKCSIPSRLTYSELIRGIACSHCTADR